MNHAKLGDTERPAQVLEGLAPDFFVGAAEDDHNDGASILGATGDETLASGIGVARLHAVHPGVAAEEAVGRAHHAHTAIILDELVLWDIDAVADDFVVVRIASSQGHVVRGRVLLSGQATGVDEVGIVHTHATRARIHKASKVFDTAGGVAGQSYGQIVEAAREHGLQQITAAVGIAHLQIHADGRSAAVGCINAHHAVQVARVANAQGGDDFLGAGHLAALVSVVRVDDVACAGVNDAHCCAIGARSRGGGLGQGSRRYASRAVGAVYTLGARGDGRLRVHDGCAVVSCPCAVLDSGCVGV